MGTQRRSEASNILRFDQQHPVNQQNFKNITHVLCTIPPVEGRDLPLVYHAQDFLKMASLQWVGYLSTTAVYGDHQGRWVDEDTTPNPSHDRARIRLEIENRYRQLWRAHQLPVHIFRLSGIYGPGRSVLERMQVERPTCVEKQGQVFSRIHVEDIAQTLIKSMENPDPGQIYNLADDHPASSCEVMDYGAYLLDQPPPEHLPYDPENLSEMARSFFQDNRRVKNDKIKQKLGVKLLYPDYKVGLQALREDAQP